MLPGVGGGELVVIAVVALIVVGPKDLPKLLRQLGRFVGKMRSMADDFRSSFEDMARQTELDELRKEVEALRTTKTLPGLEDVRQEIDAIGSDIRQGMGPGASVVRDVPVTGAVETETPKVEPEADPQMLGLPPQGKVDAPVVKKPRAGKTATKTLVESAPVVEVTPPKRSPRKTAAKRSAS